MLDIMAFTFFILIVGRLGPIPLAATNLAFNINNLAFMPLIGCGIAVSTMVGQRLGRDDPQAAEYCTWTGLHLAALYMGAMALGYLAVPKLFLAPFGHRAHDAYFDGGLYLLWSFVCAYICIMGVAFYFRFRTGRWKSMRVIERDDDTPH